jgi:hypothetical protein
MIATDDSRLGRRVHCVEEGGADGIDVKEDELETDLGDRGAPPPPPMDSATTSPRRRKWMPLPSPPRHHQWLQWTALDLPQSTPCHRIQLQDIRGRDDRWDPGSMHDGWRRPNQGNGGNSMVRGSTSSGIDMLGDGGVNWINDNGEECRSSSVE